MLHNIPAELRARKQWVVATGNPGPDGKPCKIPLDPRTGQRADVTDPETWGTWEDAEASPHRFKGYVLSADDPYVIIDLDATDDAGIQARHAEIYEAFQTYAELSQSGGGAHIVCEGAILRNIKSASRKIEVYSKDRYMIFTGDALKTMPIVNCQPMLDKLVRTLDACSVRAESELVQVDSNVPDDEIIRMAKHASNRENFCRVYEAADLDLPEADDSGDDFALMDMLHFYTQDYEQCRRLFMASGRGKRAKGRNQKYLDRMLRKLAAERVPLIDLTELLRRSNASKPTPMPTSELSPDDFPPGLVGEISHYIFNSAFRPVAEIALATGLATMAGICGRTYNVSGTGLNIYPIIVAKTGCGKEGAAKGMGMIFNALRAKVPAIADHRGPAHFASGQALIKALDKRPCFVSVLGEFGLFLKRITDERASGNDTMLRAVLLDLFSKSGAHDALFESVYSDTANNTKIVQSPCVTILGETTPESLFDSLGIAAVTDGTLPRFSIMEYTGDLPRPNKRHGFVPPPEMIDRLAALALLVVTAAPNHNVNVVALDAEGAEAMDAFSEECDDNHRKSNSGAEREIWTRAHLKALKTAALVAVGIDFINPVIGVDAAKWACNLVRRDIAKLQERFQIGDMGSGDTKREAEVRKAFTVWENFSKESKRKYRATEKMLTTPVIPIYFLKQRLRQLPAFRGKYKGDTQILNETLEEMRKAGEIKRYPADQAKAEFDTAQDVYVKGEHFYG